MRATLDLRLEGAPGAFVRYADVVATHPVSLVLDSTKANASHDGHQAASWERIKRGRYSQDVLPLAVETYGRWGLAAVRFLRELARGVASQDPRLAHLGRWAAAALTCRWYTRLAVCLQTANVQAATDAFAIPRGRWHPGGSPQPQWRAERGADALAAWELLSGRFGAAGASDDL